MKKLLVLLLILGLFGISGIYGQSYELRSPDGKICVTVNVGDVVMYKVMHGKTVVIDESAISMELGDGKTLGLSGTVGKVERNIVNETIHADFYKKSEVKNNYNELIIKFKGNYKLTFRAFDDGVAYRFSTSFRKPIIVKVSGRVLRFYGVILDATDCITMVFANVNTTVTEIRTTIIHHITSSTVAIVACL